MAIVLSEAQAEALNQQITSAKNRAKAVMERAKEESARLLHQAESGATAYGFGYARGRYPDRFKKGIFGYAPDLVAGIVGDAAVAFGMARGFEDHATAVSTGAFCAYLTSAGMKAGSDAATAANEPAGPFIGDPSVAAEGSGAQSDPQIRALMEELAELKRKHGGG